MKLTLTFHKKPATLNLILALNAAELFVNNQEINANFMLL
jgi:hypothetical protein